MPTTEAGPLAYVLAGGQSTRFGSDKAVHELAGVSMLQATLAVLQSAGWQAHVCAPFDRPLHATSVWEPPRASRHPLFGVAAALDHARARGARWALVCPCDLPELDLATVLALRAGAHPRHAPGQPLLAVLPVKAAALAEALALMGAPVRRLHEALGSRALAGAPPLNLNEPGRLPR